MNAALNSSIRKKKNARASGIIIGALLLLFLSEAILREAAVSSLKTADKNNLDQVLSILPAFLRSRIKEKLELLSLKDAVKKAKTDIEKINALTALASYIKDENEKASLFTEILNMPRMPESYAAMMYFLERDSSDLRISIADYQRYVADSPVLNRYSLWIMGLNELRNKNKSYQLQLDFLKPLLNDPQRFYDYGQLYRTIYDLALKVEDNECAQKAAELIASYEEFPTMREELEKLQKAKDAHQGSLGEIMMKEF